MRFEECCLTALRIPTIQTSSTPIHDHDGLGVALVAHGGGRRERRAVAGDFDDFLRAAFGGAAVGGLPFDFAPLRGATLGASGGLGYFSVFF